MDYHLFDDSDDAPGISVAKADLASNLAAVEWAKDWLNQCATNDLYTIERADRRFAASLMQTAGGQWYAMPKTGFFAVE